MKETEKLFVIDRIEGDFAVCAPDNGGDTIDIPLSIVPAKASEGTALVIVIEYDGSIAEIKSVRRATEEERPNTKNDNQKRLHSLFDNIKKEK